jgi:hypothetical protein
LSFHLLSKNLSVKIYETIILPAVLFGCGIWSLTLRKEHRFGMSENRVKRIFGLKREEMARGWRRLYHDFLCMPYQILV